MRLMSKFLFLWLLIIDDPLLMTLTKKPICQQEKQIFMLIIRDSESIEFIFRFGFLIINIHKKKKKNRKRSRERKKKISIYIYSLLLFLI